MHALSWRSVYIHYFICLQMNKTSCWQVNNKQYKSTDNINIPKCRKYQYDQLKVDIHSKHHTANICFFPPNPQHQKYDFWIIQSQYFYRSPLSIHGLHRQHVTFPLTLFHATLTSHVSKTLMSASPSSPLFPLTLHSANSIFIGPWEKSYSLPFRPKGTEPAMPDPSKALGAPERIVRRVFLWEKKKMFWIL